MFPSCDVHLSGGESGNIVQRLGYGTLDAAFLPMPIDEADLVMHQVARDPLVACIRADDPIARELEIPLPVLAARLRAFRDPQSDPSAHRQIARNAFRCGNQAGDRLFCDNTE